MNHIGFRYGERPRFVALTTIQSYACVLSRNIDNRVVINYEGIDQTPGAPARCRSSCLRYCQMLHCFLFACGHQLDSSIL